MRALTGTSSPLAAEDRLVFEECFALLEYKRSRLDRCQQQRASLDSRAGIIGNAQVAHLLVDAGLSYLQLGTNAS